MSNNAFILIHKYALQLAEMDGYLPGSCKVMVNLNGRIYETEDGCDFGNLQPKDISIVSGATGSAYPVEHNLLRNEEEMKAVVLSKTPYCKRIGDFGGDLVAAVDDMAQIVGPKVYCVAYDGKEMTRALHKAAGCFVRGQYTVTLGRNLYEAVTALQVLEKAAEIDTKAETIGGIKPIPLWEAKFMRHHYQKKYSKAEQAVKSAEGS